MAGLPRRNALEREAVILIILVAVGLALVWVFRVPFFEEPDENTHADYAFTLFSVHAPFRAQSGRPATDVHPLVRYLEKRSNFRRVRYNPDGRVQAGYGSAAFYGAVDAGAPRVPADFLAHNGDRVPWVAQHYVYFYYALDALAIGAASLVSGGSAVAEFFGARIFNVVLLAISLTLAYLTLRELGVGRPLRLGLLAAIGWFPLTTWVSAYIQPDNLAFTAISLVFYLSVRLRREPDALRSALWLGLALGLLAMTKSQYFIAVALPALADRTVRSAPRLRTAPQWLKYAALICLPVIALVASSLIFEAGEAASIAQTVGENGTPLAVVAARGPEALATYVSGETISFLNRAFWSPFVSYWGMISWTVRQVRFGDAATTVFVYYLIGTASLVIFALVVARTLGRLDPARAHRATLGPRVLALAVFRRDLQQLHALHRDSACDLADDAAWKPGAVLVAVHLAGDSVRDALRPTARRAAPARAPDIRDGRHLCSGFIFRRRIDCGVRDARRPILSRADGAQPVRILREDHADRRVRSLRSHRRRARAGRAADVARRVGDRFAIRCAGAYAPTSSSTVVFAFPLSVGLMRPDLLVRVHDDDLAPSGFVAALPATLSEGPHTVRLDVYERERAAPYPGWGDVRIMVGPPPGSTAR